MPVNKFYSQNLDYLLYIKLRIYYKNNPTSKKTLIFIFTEATFCYIFLFQKDLDGVNIYISFLNIYHFGILGTKLYINYK